MTTACLLQQLWTSPHLLLLLLLLLLSFNPAAAGSSRKNQPRDGGGVLQHGGQRNREDIQLTAAPENKGGAESVLPNSHFHLSSLTPFLSVWLISGNVQSTVQPSEGANSRFHGL